MSEDDIREKYMGHIRRLQAERDLLKFTIEQERNLRIRGHIAYMAELEKFRKFRIADLEKYRKRLQSKFMWIIYALIENRKDVV